MKKQIELDLQAAKAMYGKNPLMDLLILSNFTIEELTKKELPKTWEELGRVSGYSLRSDSKIVPMSQPSNNYNKNNFATEEQAKSALAMAQLSQLMTVYNDGWEPNWNDGSVKFCIERTCDCITKINSYHTYYFLSFKTEELRNQFLQNFEDLIKEYYML